MVIVDSSVWVDYLNNVNNEQTQWLHSALGKVRVCLTSLILCEVLQGIRHEREFLETCEELTAFPVIEDMSTDLAVASAKYFRTLQKKGITVRKTVDCIIAATCIEQGHSLLHKDRDFMPFETHLGLQVIDPKIRPEQMSVL